MEGIKIELVTFSVQMDETGTQRLAWSESVCHWCHLSREEVNTKVRTSPVPSRPAIKTKQQNSFSLAGIKT